jgi:acylphosphatase
MERYTIRIDGKVQGVWFRKSAAQIAAELGIKGFIQNNADGSVYFEVEGPKEDLTKVISWCLEGPENAVVSGITLVKVPAVGLTSFEIK